MRSVRTKETQHQPDSSSESQLPIPLDNGTMMLSMIQALIPLGLKAVEDALQKEVTALAGPRFAHGDATPGIARWGKQRGSIHLADQKLAVTVPDAFGLSKSSVSRRFIRTTKGEVERFHRRRHDDREWLVLLIDGKSFAEDQIVIALGVTPKGEKRVLGLVQTATENKRSCAAFLRELVERGFNAPHGLLDIKRWPTPWRSFGRRCSLWRSTSEDCALRTY